MAWAPSPRLFAGRGAVRGLGEWPSPYAVAGVFDPERKILVIVPIPVTI